MQVSNLVIQVSFQRIIWYLLIYLVNSASLRILGKNTVFYGLRWSVSVRTIYSQKSMCVGWSANSVSANTGCV